MFKISQLLLLSLFVFIASCKSASENPVMLAGDNPMRIAVGTPYVEPGLIFGVNETNLPIIDNSALDINIAGTYSVVYTYTKSNNSKIILRRVVIVGDDAIIAGEEDPLYKYQWHLHNTEQKNFAQEPGVAGEDININGIVTKDEFNGEGILIAVVDTGLEINHMDLKNNIVPGGSREFTEGRNYLTSNISPSRHGTSVAGIIAAEGWNGVGGRGVAPKAKMIGFNLLKNQNIANFISALGGADFSKEVDIFNQSYSTNTNHVIHSYPEIEAQYKFGTLGKGNMPALREGKGAIYVKAAGNGFSSIKDSDNNDISECIASKRHQLSCKNTNMDPKNTLPYNIVVGAINAKGKKSSYSSAGSSIWISAPGGEYGVTNPAILTTDQSGCNQGYSASSGSSNCNYTFKFNGTSSAAPIVSGAIAVILNVNPKLTWRDIKYILAETAEQVDPEAMDTTITINSENDYIAESKWITNKAERGSKGGYKFHNYYGFGRIDIDRAVKFTQNYTIPDTPAPWVEKEWVHSNAINQPIPNSDKNGLKRILSIGMADNLTIEAVQINLNVEHTYAGELSIELTSPLGTKSILLNAHNGFERTSCPVNDSNIDNSDKDCYKDRNLVDLKLLSNAFYGEKSQGNWILKIVDVVNLEGATERNESTENPKRTVHTGKLINWSIKIFGHER